MIDRYFESGDDASAQLGLPLLISSIAALGVPRKARRLSAMAAPSVVAARLFHRARLAGTPNGQILWVASPSGTLEYLGWAIALGEHEAGAGRTVFLCDVEPGSPTAALAAGEGAPLPSGVAQKLARAGLLSAAQWPSDLAGVRLVRSHAAPAGPEPADPSRWTLVLAGAIPEEDSDLARLAQGVDRTVYVASIRDHSIEELATEVRRLRSAGIDPVGLVTMGPSGGREPSPLEKWESVKPAASSKSTPPAPSIEPPPEPVAVDSPLDALEGESDSVEEEPESQAAPVGPKAEGDAVSLVAGWSAKRRRSPLVWIIPIAVMLLAAGWAFLRAGLPGRSEPSGDRVVEARRGDRGLPPPPVESTFPDSAATAETVAEASEGDTVEPAPATGPETAASGGAWPDTFVVHLSSWQHRTHAEQELRRIRNLGYPTRVVQVEIPGKGRWYRVVLGAFPDSLSAMLVADALREGGSVGFAQIIDSAGRGTPGRLSSRE